MSQKNKSLSKEAKREIHILIERAQQATQTGDYFLVREINNKIIALGAGGDAALTAKKQNERLAFDPFLWKFAAAVITLYGLGWVLAFFH